MKDLPIRFASPADKADVMALYDLCFPGEHEYCAAYHDRFWKPERCLIVRDGETLCAMVNLMDAAMTQDGARLEATYIFAAATRPEYRGRGLMSRMLGRSFELGRAWGKDLSILLTENDSLFAYYARLGYAPAFAVSEVRSEETPPFSMCKVRMLYNKDAEQMAALYRAHTAGRMAVARETARFLEILEEYDGRAFGLFDPAGQQLLGYCLMDEACVHACEVMGLGGGYLLYVCSMRPEEAVGRTLPRGQDDIPVGCALALSEAGRQALENAKLPPYLNILFN